MIFTLSLFTLFLTVFAEPSRIDEETHELEARASKYAPVYTTCKAPKTFALTFDDGPSKYESTLSSTLTKAGVVGTYFVNGNNWACIYDDADQIIAAYKAGHQIGQHSWSHPDLTTLTKAELRKQFNLTEIALKKIIGAVPKYMRPPFGAYNNNVREVAQEFGYKMVTWDLDTEDGDRSGKDVPYAEKQYTNYKKMPGGIALNHSPYESTVKQVVPFAIKNLKAKGYKLVSVAECLGYKPSDWYKTVGKPSKKDKTWTCNGTPAPGQA